MGVIVRLMKCKKIFIHFLIDLKKIVLANKKREYIALNYNFYN
jgi:hypothetical protein